MPWIAALFLLSLLPQISFHIGPLLLKPYRVFLLIAFVPLLVRLCSGAAGRMVAVDWLMIGASLWAALALMVNHPIGETVEPIGVIFIELLGAYMVGRVCIRSAEDFRRVVKVLFFVTLLLLVFAALESLTRQAVLLQLLGQGWAAVDTGIRFGLRRAQTVFAHPIHYGVFVSAGLGFAWYALRPDAGLLTRAACAVVIALSTFLSLSTGALLAFVMQCGFIAWETVTAPHPKRWRVFAWGALAGYVVLDLITTRSPFHTLVNYASFSHGSGYNRILIWQYGTDNVAANPVFGLGLNDWEKPEWMSDSVDNFWLLLTMQYGLPFIAMFAGALFLILRRVSRRELADPVDRACRAGYLTTFGGIVIAGGTVHYWQTMFAFVLFLFGTGLWMISGGARPEPAGAVSRDGQLRRGGGAGPAGEAPRRKRPVL
jgi:O-Antigen ligase